MSYVVKYNGKKALRSNCRRINKQYYEKNIDCFLINGKWNRIDNGLITFDYETSKWVRKDQTNLREGYVNKTDLGLFSPSDNNVSDTNGVWYINEDVAISRGLVESLNSELFVPKTSKRTKGIKGDYGKRGYNISNQDINYLTNEFNKRFFGSLRSPKLMRFLRGYKFGLEFETANGYIRKKKLLEHGVKPLLDGSLRKDGVEPFEFTTIPYSGTKGVAAIKSFCNVLDLHCTYDHRCSLHIHISGHSTKRKDVLRLYKILYDIQQEVFEMFPYYKLEPSVINKTKNYCQKLPNIFKPNFEIDEDLNPCLSRLFKVLTNYNLSDEYNFKTGHQLFENTSKWNIPGRYTWVNLIPLLFGQSKTVEFRIHEPTFNEDAVVNWLLFCITILNFSSNSDDGVFKNKVNLLQILNNSEYGTELEQYYTNRAKQYSKFNNNQEFYKFAVEKVKIT